MKRGKPLSRSTGVRPRNPERLARRRAQQFSHQAKRCKLMPCCACDRPAPSDPAHIRTRGSLAGEPASVVDRANVVPLCRLCHIRQGEIPIAQFEDEQSVCLQEVADRICAQLEAEGATWD